MPSLILSDGTKVEAEICPTCGAKVYPISAMKAHEREHKEINAKLKHWGSVIPNHRYETRGSGKGHGLQEKHENVRIVRGWYKARVRDGGT